MTVMFPTRSQRFIALCIAFLFSTPACSSPDHRGDGDQQDSLIGRPPPPEQDDPFFAHALPAEAVPAAPSGRIGESEEMSVVAPEPDPAPPPIQEPHEEMELPPEMERTRRHACFSCVRICPITDGGQPDCEDADDLICGWGSHDDIDAASRTASAHCDAALDMARQMPTYSEIGGQCPTAACPPDPDSDL